MIAIILNNAHGNSRIVSQCILLLISLVVSSAQQRGENVQLLRPNNHNLGSRDDELGGVSRTGPTSSHPAASVASNPLFFIQQQQQQQHQTTANNQVLWPDHQRDAQQQSRWSPSEPSAPANQPPISQEEARQLEQYLANYQHHFEPLGQLDLANINNRQLITSNSKSVQNQANNNLFRPGDNDLRRQRTHQQMAQTTPQKFDSNSMGDISTLQEQQQQQQTKRVSPSRHDSGTIQTRRGKVDDVVVFNTNNNNHRSTKYVGPAAITSGTSALKKLVHDHIGHAPLPPGCIGRAASYTSKCEDHLIKRLNQDATEGRTVLDVSRRVCCALFWHKDCISRVVVELCPDSNPAAADLLLGSRNLDLTMSCQRFNRDGCNGSPGSLRPPALLLPLLLVCLSTLVLVASDLHRGHLRAMI